jgi:hypothetical protein
MACNQSQGDPGLADTTWAGQRQDAHIGVFDDASEQRKFSTAPNDGIV